MDRITCEEGLVPTTAALVALIIVVVILAAAFTSIPALAPAVNGSTEQPITIQGISGTVEISTNGGIEWTPLVPSDTISTGDTDHDRTE